MLKKMTYIPPPHFVEWLDGEKGRANHFVKVDPGLFPPMICKMKKGQVPITFEYAIRIERAQKPSPTPLRAVDLMTFQESRELYQHLIDKLSAGKPQE